MSFLQLGVGWYFSTFASAPGDALHKPQRKFLPFSQPLQVALPLQDQACVEPAVAKVTQAKRKKGGVGIKSRSELLFEGCEVQVGTVWFYGLPTGWARTTE